MTHDQKLADARQHISRIRTELLKVEDVMMHAGSFRGDAWRDSLMHAYEHASSAFIHALQVAVPRQGS